MSDDLEPALRSIPHFKGVPADLLSQIAATSRILRPEEGAILFREGDPCRAFYAIRSGSVRLFRMHADGREQVVHNLREGMTFAEAALLSIGRFPVAAIVTEPSTVLLEIGGERFLALLRTDARLAPAMIGSLCARLVSLVERVEELSLVQAGSRLARWLLRQPAVGTKEPAVELALPKKDLAAHLAMTPETLSRLLGRWQDEGWIENDRARVVLLDAAALIALSDGA
jgi:CRP/FNR family transcriptional regulator